MKLTISFSLLLTLSTIYAQPSVESKIEEIKNEKKIKFGGRIFWDNSFLSQDDNLEESHGIATNGTKFRQVRFFSIGSLYDHVKYKIQLDFANGNIGFYDVFIEFNKIPLIGNLRVGHHKEPFRLDAMNSLKFVATMERSYQADMMRIRNTGMSIFNSYYKGLLNYQVGIYRDADKYGNNSEAGDGYAITSRITSIPIRNYDNIIMLHLGVGYSFRKPTDKQYSHKFKAESHLSPVYLSTTSVATVENANLFNLESNFVYQSFTFQAEYTQATITRENNINDDYYSYYIQTSYFLTGENRMNVDNRTGIKRIKPKKNIGIEKGYGAIELVLRYSYINLDGNSFNIGEMSGILGGLTWYLNPYSRLLLNYNITDVNNKGSVNILQTRFQVDF